MSEEATVIEMKPNDVTIEDAKNTNVLEDLNFESKEQWENALNEMSIEIENFREELARKKYVLQFDEEYSDKVNYFKILNDFLYKEIDYTGYEFFTVEALYDNLNNVMQDVIKNPKDDVLLEYATLEAFISLILKTTGKGAKSVKKRKYIVKPFNNTYFLYEEDVRTLKSLQEKYTLILNAWNDEPVIK